MSIQDWIRQPFMMKAMLDHYRRTGDAAWAHQMLRTWTRDDWGLLVSTDKGPQFASPATAEHKLSR